MKLDVIAHLYAAAGEEEAVREVLQGLIGPTLREEGCLRYDLFVDLSDPCRFTFIEEWASVEALDAHSKSAHILEGRAKLAGKMREPNKVHRLRAV